MLRPYEDAVLPLRPTIYNLQSNRVQPWKAQPGTLVEAAHEVHTLHRRAGRALHQVVDRADADPPTGRFVQREADIGVVAAGQDLRLGLAVGTLALAHDPHERLAAIGRAVGAP